MKRLYIGNLPYKTVDNDLRDLFSQAGTVSSASVVMDKMSGRSRGFGFVEFENDAEGEKAIEMFANKDYEGRPLTVNEARPMEPRAPRAGGFRRQGGF